MANKASGTFDFSGKSVADVFDAVTHGNVSSDEATVWLQRELMDATQAVMVTKISKTMDTIKQLAGSGTIEAVKNLDGVYLYIWALTDKSARDNDKSDRAQVV